MEAARFTEAMQTLKYANAVEVIDEVLRLIQTQPCPTCAGTLPIKSYWQRRILWPRRHEHNVPSVGIAR